MVNSFYNMDCIEGTKKYIKNDSIDLIITDPPYGIDGDKLHKHYNRNEDFVIDGYVEIPAEEYEDFSLQWIKQAERILKPGGSMYIVSGYTNLFSILKALKQTNLQELNHIIWKYNFGVYTKRKYVSSHYHILYYVKPGKRHTFNTHSRYSTQERDEKNGSLNYQDREDVWIINREYKPGKVKNKNELPTALLTKMIQYSSNEGDIVCDLFLGSFSTAKVAIGLNRHATGFELSEQAFQYQIKEMDNIQTGFLVDHVKKPKGGNLENQGKAWTEKEKKQVYKRYKLLYNDLGTKKESIQKLSNEFGRGRFSLDKVIKEMEEESEQCELKL
ncbi:MAG: site-specific DNA-methyltransferase [Candidatus Marinimicrobia bacterium]|nr:site-specific DNA-methyltransferase [Candidatus Neomarinimicrobiota bacterium]